MKVSKHPEGGRIVSAASRGAVCGLRGGWEGMMGGGGGTEQRSRTKSSGDFFFWRWRARKKKRGSKHESLNFFFFPPGSYWPEPPSRLPKWRALNVSARTDHSLLQPRL